MTHAGRPEIRIAPAEPDARLRVRGRLVRQVLSESLLLGAIGGFVGLLLAAWALDLLVAIGPGDVTRLATARVDGRVFAFSAALSVAVAFVFGLVPAFASTRSDLATVMRQAVAGGGAHGQRLRAALVASELALSVVLLVCALLGRSFLNLQRVDLGFDADRVLAMGLPLPETEPCAALRSE